MSGPYLGVAEMLALALGLSVILAAVGAAAAGLLDRLAGDAGCANASGRRPYICPCFRLC